MQAASSLDLARTRAAFDSWRARQPGRRRIPEHLWQMAIALLDIHPISHVARELRLSPKQLRLRKLSTTQPRSPNSATGPSFVQIQATDLAVGAAASRSAPAATSQTETYLPSHCVEPEVRLVFERCNGDRLTLCLPASAWTRIETLCTSFIRR